MELRTSTSTVGVRPCLSTAVVFGQFNVGEGRRVLLRGRADAVVEAATLTRPSVSLIVLSAAISLRAVERKMGANAECLSDARALLRSST